MTTQQFTVGQRVQVKGAGYGKIEKLPVKLKSYLVKLDSGPSKSFRPEEIAAMA